MALLDWTENDTLIEKIESVPNLRLLCSRSQSSIDNYTNAAFYNGAVYRSSKPDRITAEDVVHFKELGIKTIVDFRSLDEYRKTDGMCFLDKEYSVYKVLLPKKYESDDKVEAELVAKCDAPRTEMGDPSRNRDMDRKHYLIDFFRSGYILAALKRVPWYIMLLGMLHAVYDFFKKNKFKTFINFFIQHSINRGDLKGQYQDLVDSSGSSICAALKLISNPENMPVLINCAHGKDRTGIISALILVCLGMSEDYIKMEYSLSAKGLESIQHIMHEEMVEKLKLRQTFLRADAETMHELLTYVKEKHGSVQQYMTSIGFNEDDQQRLRDHLVPRVRDDCVSIGLTPTVNDGTGVDVKDVLMD